MGAVKVWNKLLGGQFGSVLIANTHLNATDKQLAGYANRQGREAIIQNIGLGICHRPPDRWQLRPRSHITRQRVRRDHMGFGRPILIVQAGIRRALKDGPNRWCYLQLLAGNNDITNRQISQQPVLYNAFGQRLEGGIRQKQPFDFFIRNKTCERWQITAHSLIDHDERAALLPGTEYFLKTDIKTEGRKLKRARRF